MDPESLDLPQLELKGSQPIPWGWACGYFKADESRQEEIRRHRGGEDIQAWTCSISQGEQGWWDIVTFPPSLGSVICIVQHKGDAERKCWETPQCWSGVPLSMWLRLSHPSSLLNVSILWTLPPQTTSPFTILMKIPLYLCSPALLTLCLSH